MPFNSNVVELPYHSYSTLTSNTLLHIQPYDKLATIYIFNSDLLRLNISLMIPLLRLRLML